MSRFTANNSFMRQIRAAHFLRQRALEQASERDRIFRDRCQAASIDPAADDAYLAAAGHVLRDTPFSKATLAFTDERLWIGDGDQGTSLKHQSGFGLRAMQACVAAWDGPFTWDPEHPPADVVLSVRDWLEPVERWSWDVRRTGDAPSDQPSFW